MQELVSIILPVYNGEQFLVSAIESCVAQSYNNFELIVIDDCSEDKTQEIVESYCRMDDRIKYYRNSKNLKLPSSLNFGHKMASGDLVTWTSHDNTYSRDAIDKMVKRLLLDSVDIVYADMYIINETDKILRSERHPRIENLIFRNHIGACFLYKKSVFDKLNGFRNLFLVEDYDFWLRASKYFKFSHIQEELYYYRIHNKSLTSSISFNSYKGTLYSENISIVLSDFVDDLGIENSHPLKSFLINNIRSRSSNFQSLKRQQNDLFAFIDKLESYEAFTSKKRLKQQLLKVLIYNLLRDSQNNGYRLTHIYFFFKNFYKLIGFNEIKSLSRYFFKCLPKMVSRA